MMVSMIVGSREASVLLGSHGPAVLENSGLTNDSRLGIRNAHCSSALGSC